MAPEPTPKEMAMSYVIAHFNGKKWSPSTPESRQTWFDLNLKVGSEEASRLRAQAIQTLKLIG